MCILYIYSRNIVRIKKWKVERRGLRVPLVSCLNTRKIDEEEMDKAGVISRYSILYKQRYGSKICKWDFSHINHNKYTTILICKSRQKLISYPDTNFNSFYKLRIWITFLSNCIWFNWQHFRGLSFPTISSVGPNGAIIHYNPEPETCAELDPNQMYLCDSGAQVHYLPSQFLMLFF